MPRINVKPIAHNENLILKNVINYVAKEDRCFEGYISATGVYLPGDRRLHTKLIEKEIYEQRNFFNKKDTRLGIHIEIAFSPEELAYITKQQILEIGHYVAQNEFAGCMTYFAVHDHTELPHLDMLLVPLNVVTGKMYGCSKEGWNAIELRLQTHLLNYMPEEAIGGFQVSYQKY